MPTQTEKTIAVFGDACIDIFTYGKCNRLCPEAPVPILIPQYTESNDGMALNVARNIVNMGYSCIPITNDKNKIVKHRYVESSMNHIIIRVDQEEKVNPLELKEVSDHVWNCDCAVISDYDKGFLTETVMQEISERIPLSFLDTKKKIGNWANSFSFIKINEDEFSRTMHNMSALLLNKTIVTLGKRGCRYLEKVYSPPSLTHTVNVCGAGDTFLAGLVTAYCASNDIEKSLEYALHCSSIVVKNRGVSVPFSVENTND